MLLAWAQHQLPPLLLPSGAICTSVTTLAVLSCKADQDCCFIVAIYAGLPGAAELACWTDSLLGIPIQHKLGIRNTTLGAGLPRAIGLHRSDQLYLLLLAVDQRLGIDVTAIDIVLTWQQIARRQVCLNGWQHGMVVDTGGRGRHLRDQVGRVILAGLGQMHGVANPPGVALGFVARLNVIGRANDLGRWRLFVVSPPAQDWGRRV